jgi:hypothetical protein
LVTNATWDYALLTWDVGPNGVSWTTTVSHASSRLPASIDDLETALSWFGQNGYELVSHNAVVSRRGFRKGWWGHDRSFATAHTHYFAFKRMRTDGSH